MIWTLAFWKGAGERAIKTAAQTAVGLMGTSALIERVPWAVVASGTAFAVILSVVTSIGNADFTAGVPATAEELGKAITLAPAVAKAITHAPVRAADEEPVSLTAATAPDPAIV